MFEWKTVAILRDTKVLAAQQKRGRHFKNKQILRWWCLDLHRIHWLRPHRIPSELQRLQAGTSLLPRQTNSLKCKRLAFIRHKNRRCFRYPQKAWHHAREPLLADAVTETQGIQNHCLVVTWIQRASI
jgi:hypothetical protein